jgi:hypothetical protein
VGVPRLASIVQAIVFASPHCLDDLDRRDLSPAGVTILVSGLR